MLWYAGGITRFSEQKTKEETNAELVRVFLELEDEQKTEQMR